MKYLPALALAGIMVATTATKASAQQVYARVYVGPPPVYGWVGTGPGWREERFARERARREWLAREAWAREHARREHEWREHEWREHEWRERAWNDRRWR